VLGQLTRLAAILRKEMPAASHNLSRQLPCQEVKLLHMSLLREASPPLCDWAAWREYLPPLPLPLTTGYLIQSMSSFQNLKSMGGPCVLMW
jgi:hypothetical protein